MSFEQMPFQCLFFYPHLLKYSCSLVLFDFLISWVWNCFSIAHPWELGTVIDANVVESPAPKTRKSCVAQVHPRFLNSLELTHTDWAFGGVSELIDNARDAGATRFTLRSYFSNQMLLSKLLAFNLSNLYKSIQNDQIIIVILKYSSIWENISTWMEYTIETLKSVWVFCHS